MSTSVNHFLKQFLYVSVALSAWAMAMSVSYDKSVLAGGDQEALAREIMVDVNTAVELSPACSWLAFQVIEKGLKARAGQWMPTAAYLSVNERRAADDFENGGCPVSSFPVIAFAIADIGGKWEDERMKRRAERW